MSERSPRLLSLILLPHHQHLIQITPLVLPFARDNHPLIHGLDEGCGIRWEAHHSNPSILTYETWVLGVLAHCPKVAGLSPPLESSLTPVPDVLLLLVENCRKPIREDGGSKPSILGVVVMNRQVCHHILQCTRLGRLAHGSQLESVLVVSICSAKSRDPIFTDLATKCSALMSKHLRVSR